MSALTNLTVYPVSSFLQTSRSRETWDIISAGLRERALFVLVIGLAFIGGGLLAGPGRHELAVRRFLAPYLRDHPNGS